MLVIGMQGNLNLSLLLPTGFSKPNQERASGELKNAAVAWFSATISKQLFERALS